MTRRMQRSHLDTLTNLERRVVGGCACDLIAVFAADDRDGVLFECFFVAACVVAVAVKSVCQQAVIFELC